MKKEVKNIVCVCLVEYFNKILDKMLFTKKSLVEKREFLSQGMKTLSI